MAVGQQGRAGGSRADTPQTKSMREARMPSCLAVSDAGTGRARTRAMFVADSAALQASIDAEGSMHLMSLSRGKAICSSHTESKAL